MTRPEDVALARAAADEWASAHGLPPSAGYSGTWYQNGYLGGWWPDGWLRWWADYNGNPGNILGGQIVAHQYGSDPIDQDAMLESEIFTVPAPNPLPDDPCAAIEAAHDALVVTVADITDRLGDALLAECTRANVRKSIVRGIVAQMAQEREQAIGERPG